MFEIDGAKMAFIKALNEAIVVEQGHLGYECLDRPSLEHGNPKGSQFLLREIRQGKASALRIFGKPIGIDYCPLTLLGLPSTINNYYKNGPDTDAGNLPMRIKSKPGKGPAPTGFVSGNVFTWSQNWTDDNYTVRKFEDICMQGITTPLKAWGPVDAKRFAVP